MRKTLLLALALTACFLTTAHLQNNAREDAYRANNLGVALLEQFKHKEAADAFRRALQLDPGLVVVETQGRFYLDLSLLVAEDGLVLKI